MSSEVSLLCQALGSSETRGDTAESSENDEQDKEAKERLVKILQKWTESEKKGFRLVKENADLVRILLKIFLTNRTELFKQVNTVLTACLNYEEMAEGPPTDLFDDSTLEMVRVKLMPVLKTRLEETKDPQILGHWNLIVNLLGRHLHTGAALINGLMTVVERAFKLNEPPVIEAAFRSWMVLMTNFSLSRSILTSSKRVALLNRPLEGVKNTPTEACYRAKFDAWWHLITLLHQSNFQHMETIVLPFLKICYGPRQESCATKDTVNSPSTPSTPFSPVKKFASLQKSCLDVLVQVLAVRPLNSGLPRPDLASNVDSQALSPLQASQGAELLVHCLLESSCLVNPANKSEVVKLSEAWRGLLTLQAAREVTPDSTQAVTTAWQHIFSGLKLMVMTHRRQVKLSSLLAGVLEEVSGLSVKVLNHAANTTDHKKPSVLVVEMLLYQAFNGLTNPLLRTLETMFTKLVAPPAILASLAEVLTKLENWVPNLSATDLESLQQIWQSLAGTVSRLEVLSDQPSGVLVTFNTCLNLLKFPLVHLATRGPDAKTFKTWSRLYKSLVEQSEVTVSHQTSFICHEMTEKLESLVSSEQTAGQLGCLAKSAQIMIDNIDFRSLALSVKGSSDQPLGRFKRYNSPLGQGTSVVSLLRVLTDTLASLVRDRADKKIIGQAAEDLLGAFRTLLNHNQEELARSVLKMVSPSVALILEEDLLKSLVAINASVLTLVESVLTAYCSILKVKFNGNYSEDFLLEVEEVFVKGMESPRKTILNKISEMWSVTFSTLPKSQLSEKLKLVMKKSSTPGLRTQVSSSNSEVSFPSSDDLSQQMTVEPAIAAGMKLSKHSAAVTNSAEKNSKREVKEPPPNSQRQKRARKSLSLRLEEEDSAMFVPIKPKPVKKRVLTAHQKDRMTSRHDDIPALYSELSRDDSVVHLPPQFMSQDSVSMVENFKRSEETKEDAGKAGEAKADMAIIEDKPVSNNVEAVKVGDNVEVGDGDSQSLLKEMKARKNKRFEPTAQVSPVRGRRSLSTRDVRKPQSIDQEENKKNGTEKIFDIWSPSKPVELTKGSDENPVPEKLQALEDSKKPDDESTNLEDNNGTFAKPVNVNIQRVRLTPEKIAEVQNDSNVQADSTGTVKKNLFDTSSNPINDLSINTSKTSDTSLDISTNISVNNSVNTSTDEEVIESSQDTTDSPKRKRSMRRPVDRNDQIFAGMSPSKRSPRKGGHVDDKRNQYGETPLHTAAKKGDVAKVKDLLKAGASPNVTDAAGWYPLHEVAMSVKDGALDILTLLIEHGANVDSFSTGERGVTPLQDAVLYGSKEVVATLVKAGADTGLPSKEGKTALDLVEESETQGMMEVLMSVIPKKTEKIEDADESSKSKKVVDSREVEGESAVDEQKLVDNSEPNQPCQPCPETEGMEVEDNNDSPGASVENGGLEEAVISPVKTVINDTLEIEHEDDKDSQSDSSQLEEANQDSIMEEVLPIIPEEASRTSTVISPDANKENVEANDDLDNSTDKVPPLVKDEGLRIKSPFTAVNEKQKVKKSVVGGSRGAMLLSLSTSRRASLDTAMQAPNLMSPKLEGAGGKTDTKRPWMKYNPSPSSASPSASILKRQRGEDLDSSSEGSPVSAKRARLEGSLPRRVHFNDNPVSDSVEIPRAAADGVNTRKKLMMFDQEVFTGRQPVVNTEDMEDSGPTVYQDSPLAPVACPSMVFPDLADCQDSVVSILHNLATGNWGKVLEADLKTHNICTVGQLASLNTAQIKTLKGIKPPKDVTVKNTLKQFLTKTRNVDQFTLHRVKKAPVEEMEATPDEEEEIKAALFARPSPSPTDLGDSPFKEDEEEDKSLVKSLLEDDKSEVESESSQLTEDSADEVKTEFPQRKEVNTEQDSEIDIKDNRPKEEAKLEVCSDLKENIEPMEEDSVDLFDSIPESVPLAKVTNTELPPLDTTSDDTSPPPEADDLPQQVPEHSPSRLQETEPLTPLDNSEEEASNDDMIPTSGQVNVDPVKSISLSPVEEEDQADKEHGGGEAEVATDVMSLLSRSKEEQVEMVANLTEDECVALSSSLSNHIIECVNLMKSLVGRRGDK